MLNFPKKNGRVTEITRLNAQEGGWTSEYNWVSGDAYRHGPTFERELEAGTYYVEVHTPDNLEKYVLRVGNRDGASIGYFEMIRRLVAVKKFFGKSPVRIVESPYVYLPIVGMGILSFGVWYMRRRNARAL